MAYRCLIKSFLNQKVHDSCNFYKFYIDKYREYMVYYLSIKIMGC